VFRSTLPHNYDPVMRFGGWTEVTALDTRPYVAALPELLAGWRALTFAGDGVVHPVTKVVHQGFRLVDGTHPYPGARYRLITREETAPEPTAHDLAVAERLGSTDARAAAEWERGRLAAARASGHMVVTWHTFDIRLGTDGPQRTTFTVHHDVTDTRARIDLTTPSLPGPIDIALDVPDWAGTTAFLRGTVQVLLRVDASGPLPRMVAFVSHPRGRAHAEVDVTAAPGGRWVVKADVDARGSGWMRPLVGAMAPFARRPLKHGLDDMLRELSAHVADLAERYPSPPPDPHTLAETLLADLISEVLVRV
jgi:hypothetical protein